MHEKRESKLAEGIALDHRAGSVSRSMNDRRRRGRAALARAWPWRSACPGATGGHRPQRRGAGPQGAGARVGAGGVPRGPGTTCVTSLDAGGSRYRPARALGAGSWQTVSYRENLVRPGLASVRRSRDMFSSIVCSAAGLARPPWHSGARTCRAEPALHHLSRPAAGTGSGSSRRVPGSPKLPLNQSLGTPTACDAL